MSQPMNPLERLATYNRAVELLTRLASAPSPAAQLELVGTLLPESSDYEKVFVPEVVEQARKAYEALWIAPRPLEIGPHQTTLRVVVASGAELAAGAPVLQEFPGGYAEIADLLLPDSIWVHWKHLSPGSTTGMAYDGLVRIGERWVWLPKPYRLLRRPVVRAPQATPAAASAQSPSAAEPKDGTAKPSKTWAE